MILLFAVCTFAQHSARALYERARLLDESNQNLAEAIRLYREVISQAKEQRALAAGAQYRIGVLNERLGRKAQAQRAFRGVVTHYPEQTDLARRAREKIPAAAATRKPAALAIVKQSGPSVDGWYRATFTSLTEQLFGRPVIDPARQRLYVIISNFYEPRDEVEQKRVERQGLRYVYEPSSLIVIDTEKNLISKTIPLSVYLDHIAFNPANNRLYGTAQASGQIKVIDTFSFAQTKIPVPGHPTGIAVNATTNKIYVTSQGFAGNDKLFVIDGATDAIAGPYDLDGVAGQLVVNSATNRIYAYSAPKTRVFHGADNSVVADLPGINVLEVDPAHHLIYAVTSDGRNIQVLDQNTHVLVSTFGSSSVPSELALDIHANRLYALLSDNRVAVIDINTLTDVGRLVVAEAPVSLAVNPRTGHIYITHTANPSLIGVLAGRDLKADIPEEWSDSFDSPALDSGWSILSGQGSYSLSENPGHLRFRVAKPSGLKPQLLIWREFRGDHWTLEVKASYFTGASGGSRSLSFGITLGGKPVAGPFKNPLNQKPTNAVYTLRWRDEWNGCCPGITEQFFVENSKVAFDNKLPPNPADAYFWRIKRHERKVTVERSDDGVHFTLVGFHIFGPQIDGAIQFFSIGYQSFANSDAYADFDYIRLSKAPAKQNTRANGGPLPWSRRTMASAEGRN